MNFFLHLFNISYMPINCITYDDNTTMIIIILKGNRKLFRNLYLFTIKQLFIVFSFASLRNYYYLIIKCIIINFILMQYFVANTKKFRLG